MEVVFDAIATALAVADGSVHGDLGRMGAPGLDVLGHAEFSSERGHAHRDAAADGIVVRIPIVWHEAWIVGARAVVGEVAEVEHRARRRDVELWSIWVTDTNAHTLDGPVVVVDSVAAPLVRIVPHERDEELRVEIDEALGLVLRDSVPDRLRAWAQERGDASDTGVAGDFVVPVDLLTFALRGDCGCGDEGKYEHGFSGGSLPVGFCVSKLPQNWHFVNDLNKKPPDES